MRLPALGSFCIHFGILRNWYQFIDKAIVIKKLKQIPTSDEEDLLVMAICGPLKQLAFTKPGYDSWIMVEPSFRYRFVDVAYLNDQIYALCGTGTLVLVDHNSQPSKVEFIASPPHRLAWEILFLVESSGNLLMVYQYFHVNPYDPSSEKIHFEVHGFDFDAKEWKQLEDLGDLALFVGDNYSMSVAASKFPNCRGNSIYFAGSKLENFSPIDKPSKQPGVYNMADGCIETFSFGSDSPSYYSCPIWVTPSLCKRAFDSFIN